MTKWLQGKKTYIGAAGLFLAAVLGWWFGGVTESQALGMIAGAFGLAGLGARSTRYAELTLKALEEIKGRRWEELSNLAAQTVLPMPLPPGAAGAPAPIEISFTSGDQKK